MDIVAGTYGERDPSDGLVFNTCNYVDKYGQILMSYHKVHLW
jgi:predicted amidohydrolase